MKEVQLFVAQISEISGLATSKEQAIELGLKHFLSVDNVAHYGGYRVCSVSVENGGHSGAFGESSVCKRRTKKEMLSFLNGYLNALQLQHTTKTY